MALRVVLADDHYLVREGMRRLLDAQPEIEVVAVCDDLDSLLAAVEAERPDVVVTDIRMPPDGPTRASEPPTACARRTRGRRGRAQPVRRAAATRSRC